MAEKVAKEILYHHRFLDWLDSSNINYDTWGSSGPDVILDDFSLLGEFKISETKSSYRNALIEIQKRTKAEFNIRFFKYFFILTKEKIRIYRVSDILWDIDNFEIYAKDFNYIEKCIACFENTDKDKSIFIEYIKNNCKKISIEGHLPEVLDLLLSDSLNLSIMDAIIIISRLNEDPVFLRKSIVFGAGSNTEYSIDFDSHEELEQVRDILINRFYISDFKMVKEYIKYNYSSHLSDTKKSNLGKYYTPKYVVEFMKEWLKPLISKDTFLMDIACGCGAFLDIFSDCHVIGRDIDSNAVEVLKILGFPNVETDNSLIDINREKYGLNVDDKLIIIGNPPYNDTTSKNKRFGTRQKSTVEFEIDKEVHSNDLGQSFLKAYAKLNPEYICVLHPLSYLIKQSNFRKLGYFTENYKLVKGIVFSSAEFPDLKGNTEFPVLIALYKRGNMDYDYIKKFKFHVLGEDKLFVLERFETIDCLYGEKNYIRKYPIKKDREHIEKSDINLYQYNIRDTNSLMSSGNLMCLGTTDNLNYVTINYDELYKYCYLNMYKLFFQNDFLTGNLSPLVRIAEYEKDIDLQNLMIIGTILKNSHRVSCLDFRDKDSSIIYKKFLVSDFRKYAKTYSGTPNFYKIFLDIVDGEGSDENLIYELIINYFKQLKESFF